jgi:hypothetical protein
MGFYDTREHEYHACGEVQAWQFDLNDRDNAPDWVDLEDNLQADGTLYVFGEKGAMFADQGDWIVLEDEGVLMVRTEERFAAMYKHWTDHDDRDILDRD